MKRTITLFFILSSITLFAQNIDFPDENFKCALLNHVSYNPNTNNSPFVDNYNAPIDTNGDGEISITEAANTMDLDFRFARNAEACGVITDFTGIEHFVNLTELAIWGSPSRVDLSENSIDLSALVNLNRLIISDSFLTEIDVSNNTNLDFLGLDRNLLTSIDLSENTVLDYLGLSKNLIEVLDARDCALNFLFIPDNPNLRTLYLANQPFEHMVNNDQVADPEFNYYFEINNCLNLEFICIDEIFVDFVENRKTYENDYWNYSDYTVSSDCGDPISYEFSDILTLFPNPTTTGELNLEINDTFADPVSLETTVIYGLSGQVWGFVFHGGTSSPQSMNFSYLFPGTYVIEVTTNIGIYTTQFVKL